MPQWQSQTLHTKAMAEVEKIVEDGSDPKKHKIHGFRMAKWGILSGSLGNWILGWEIKGLPFRGWNQFCSKFHFGIRTLFAHTVHICSFLYISYINIYIYICMYSIYIYIYTPVYGICMFT